MKFSCYQNTRSFSSLILGLVISLAVIPKASAEMEMYFIHNDHLGTPAVITDKNQTVVWERNQKPFGETDDTTSAIENDSRFPGQYHDEESGLHYNYFRDYDPTIGRYIQSDPIGLQGGINTYAYVGGNPVRYFDPYGLWASQYGAHVHQNAIRSALYEGPSRWHRRENRSLISNLINATVHADSAQFQNAESAFRHAMRSGSQTASEARALAELFIRNQFKKAKNLKACGNESAAQFEFGIALHTLQDYTSPSHHGFQQWTGEETAGEIIKHVYQELLSPGNGSNLDRITRDAINWYQSGTLPSGSVFDGYGSD